MREQRVGVVIGEEGQKGIIKNKGQCKVSAKTQKRRERSADEYKIKAEELSAVCHYILYCYECLLS